MQPMLIAPFKVGLNTDEEPWLLSPDAFQEADNVHVKHGYIEKRQGYRLFGTLENGDPVMGLLRYLENDGTFTSLAFDTTEGYIYNSGTGSYDTLNSGSAILASGVNDYVWGVNWHSSTLSNRLYYTNGLAYTGSVNGIQYYPGASATQTAFFTPSIGGSPEVFLYGAKLLFTLNQRLVCLYTYEYNGTSTITYPQRARWCAKQDPSNWNDVTAGGGDFADAATGDQIISARSLQNQIIVFFTNSVWTLIPTADPNKAFRWQRLNDFRACDGKMASVGFDRYVPALGIRGITASDGNETQRIDDRIQTFTINNINTEAFGKVFCFRSYATRRWWTLYPSTNSTENDKVLIWDEDSKAFTTYDLALNCLGYGNNSLDYGLNDFTVANNLDYSLDEMGESTLQDWYFGDNEDILLGGDTNGNVYQLEIVADDVTEEVNASIISAAWNPYQELSKEAQMSYIDFYVDTNKRLKATVEFYKNDDVSPYASQNITFLPNLSYVASIIDIENTNPALISSPNHGLITGQTIYIYGVEGMDEINSGNGYTVTVVNPNSFTLDGVNATGYGTYTTDGGVYLREFYQTKTWIRAYGGGIGYLHWVKITFPSQTDTFKIHAFKPSFRAIGKRTIN